MSDGNPEIGAHARKKSLFFNLFKAFVNRGQSHIGFFFLPKKPIFLHTFATNSELPSKKE